MNNKYDDEYYNAEEISLSELFGIFRPYLIMIGIVGCVFLLVGILGSKFLIKPTYVSSATLIVNNRKEEGTGSITNDEITSAKNLASLYSIVIKSDVVMEPVVRNTYTSLSPEQLAKSVSVSSIDGSQVIRVSVSNTDPESALRYANEIVNVAPDIIVDMVEAGSVRVASKPQLPTTPSSPNIMMNGLVCFVLGIFLAAGFVLLKHVLNRTLRSSEDIEKYLGLPVVGIIPNYGAVKRGAK